MPHLTIQPAKKQQLPAISSEQSCFLFRPVNYLQGSYFDFLKKERNDNLTAIKLWLLPAKGYTPDRSFAS